MTRGEGGPNLRLHVDYLSSFHHGYLCVFTITQESEATVYLRHLDDHQARLPRSELGHLLLDELRRATRVRRFRLRLEAE